MTRPYVRMWVILATAVFLVFFVTPPARADSDLDQAIARFSDFAQREIAASDIPGISIGFVYGETQWAGGFGFADLENQVPAKDVSAYRLASVTKPMTAMAVLSLMEQGKLDLDAEVQTYVPYFPKKSYPVTCRDLLGHLGGISHYQNYEVEGHFKHHMDTREAIAVFEDFDLVAAPRARYQYSSYGYNLLGAAIEGASGMSYGDYLRSTLWGPLGMDHTRMDDPDAIIPHRVRGYRPDPNGGIRNSEFVDISSRFAAGGTRSTVNDLLAFAKGVMDGEILSQETYDLMWTPMRTAGGASTGYGMGWSVRAVNGRMMVQHGGAQAETRTFLMVLPNTGFAIAVATNFEGGDRMAFIRRLYREVLGESWQQDVYAGGPANSLLFDALWSVFNHGLAHLERYDQPLQAEGPAVAAAFARFNELTALDRVQGNVEASYAELEAAHDSAGSSLYVILGSYMANALRQAYGATYLDKAHGAGALDFFDDYIALSDVKGSTPDDHRLSEEWVRRSATWRQDWARTWNPATQDIAFTSETDLSNVGANLAKQFEGATLYPDYSGALMTQLKERFKRQDVEGAAAAASIAMRLYPEFDQPYVYAGVMNLAAGDRAEAMTLIRRAGGLDPRGASSAARMNMLAYELKGGGMLDLALAVLDAAIELHPEVANLYDSMGEFYLEGGDRKNGESYYRKALSIDPNLPSALEALETIRATEPQHQK